MYILVFHHGVFFAFSVQNVWLRVSKVSYFGFDTNRTFIKRMTLHLNRQQNPPKNVINVAQKQSRVFEKVLCSMCVPLSSSTAFSVQYYVF